MAISESLPEGDYGPTAWEALPSYPVGRVARGLVRQVAASAHATPAGSSLNSLPCVATCAPTGWWQRIQLALPLCQTESSAGFSESWPRSAIVSATTDGQLAMWERPTSACVSSSSPDAPRDAARPTPSAVDGTGGKIRKGMGPTERMPDGSKAQVSLNQAVKMAGRGPWPTPRASDGEKGGPNQRGSEGDLTLPSAAALWPTPCARDDKNGLDNREGPAA